MQQDLTTQQGNYEPKDEDAIQPIDVLMKGFHPFFPYPIRTWGALRHRMALEQERQQRRLPLRTPSPPPLHMAPPPLSPIGEPHGTLDGMDEPLFRPPSPAYSFAPSPPRTIPLHPPSVVPVLPHPLLHRWGPQQAIRPPLFFEGNGLSIPTTPNMRGLSAVGIRAFGNSLQAAASTSWSSQVLPTASQTSNDLFRAVNVQRVQYLPPSPSTRRKTKGKPKKQTTKILGMMNIFSMSRVEFGMELLKTHKLEGKIRADVDSCFPFTLWHGARNTASTIYDDDQWNAALSLIDRKPSKKQIFAEFDDEDIRAWRKTLKQRADSASDENEDESAYVQNLNNDAVDELHAEQILTIQRHWACDKHKCDKRNTEHDEGGYCYIHPTTGEHIGLHRARLREWADAIVAKRATVNTPPSSPLFDIPTRSRGRQGPKKAKTDARTDAGEVALQAIQIFSAIVNKSFDAPLAIPGTSLSHSLHQSELQPSTSTSSGLPHQPSDLSNNISAFFEDFKTAKGIDLTDRLDILEDFTPDMLRYMNTKELAEFLSVPLAHVVAMKMHCDDWLAAFKPN